jgi:hypothetical protein
MPSAAEPSEPLGTDDLPDRRIGCVGCGGLLVAFGALLAWLIVGAITYLGMFSCTGPFYESGCEYCLYTIVALVKRRGLIGRLPWVWSAAAALIVALVVLFVGSPWPKPDPTPYATTTATAATPIATTAAPITTAPPPASTTSITAVRGDGVAILHGSGVGAALFGMPLDVALRGVEHYLGPPDVDYYDMHHSVEWYASGLVLWFSSDDFYRDDGVEHLVAWRLVRGSQSRLRTMAGVGIGDTLEVLSAAHGSQVVVPDSLDECLPQWYVWLNDPSADKQHRVLVVFDGPVEDQDSLISLLRAGAGHGC